ncbi:Phenylalanine ammonia-lyase [Hypsizygus marmoreus]|uniref:Phenylalanine ammonia-lyase n=1 Tax=Hypsizygus marmoreus TaxID=39966 RepID=A0A369K2B6_HYPMA|nr:Phenylalanine ammonia-lyase [Hypsizygus marmoreus]
MVLTTHGGLTYDVIAETLKPLAKPHHESYPEPMIATIPPTLLSKFVASHKELESYKNGKPVKVDGQTLSIAAVAAAARYHARAELEDCPITRERVNKSRKAIADKVENGTSVYGLSTGFGGSADTRTDQPLLLGHALLQHQHTGVLPSSTKPLEVLPLLDPTSSTSMPEAWVRGAMLIRMNSLIRGHSGVRWELIEKINELLSANITPVVPLRGSISASGDLSPLSYVAGTLIANPAIRVFHGPAAFGARQISSSSEALKQYSIEPLPLASKEHLGILNGTAFSASVASLALNDAVHLSLLAQVCTAMGTEALLGTRGSYDHFIHAVARPHPGQVECAQNIFKLLEGSKLAQLHEVEVGIHDDQYSLRQDRYPLRTSPQFLGPQIEDILSALTAVTQECNSTTDNPLVDGETGEVHHGGNFQAMAVTNAMEKTRLALHHIGKLLFAQSTELVNPAMNNGLPPSMAATDPSLNYHTKGIDIATAAYVAELGYLANPVSTHIQSAEMHNQAINSLALISARATIASLEVLSILTASYLYILCQALDIRALQSEFATGLENIVNDELTSAFGDFLTPSQQTILAQKVLSTMTATLDKTSTMDSIDRMNVVAGSTTTIFVDFLAGPEFAESSFTSAAVALISQFRSQVASRAANLLDQLRRDYLSGERGPAPAGSYLNKTRAIYEFVRVTLGIRMHGSENYARFINGLGVEDVSIGQNISLIHEAIRDGKLQPVVVSLFA